MEKTYKKLNDLIGWLCAFIATFIYFLTKEPTVSFWDCGEFIAAAYKLEIVHQPGAPLFLMLQNIFSNLALGDKTSLAYWMNTGSAVCSGLTVLFLFWTITSLAKKILVTEDHSLSLLITVKLLGAGIVGSLAFAFSDSFWFSAVESEVYALSSLCTAILFWLILKWENHAHEVRSSKWIVLIAYIIGLSIGVHLLNLLTIPVLTLVIYFKNAKQITTRGIMKQLGISFLLLGAILWGVIQYLIKAVAQFDVFFVNTLGLGFGSGIFTFIILLVTAIILGIRYSIKYNKAQLNLILLCFCFVLFGYSSFVMVFVRGTANPSLNNNHPDNIFSFLEYVTRDQYPRSPLIVGQYFDSNPIAVENGAPIYRKDAEKYTIVGHKSEYTYDRTTLFPRVHSQKDSDFYKHWLRLAENERPTFWSNLQFFTSYQAGVMFWRYFMWNFVGRQNDESGQFGNLTDGNWLSGIKAIDHMRLGGQYDLPSSVKQDPSRNHFYFLPLLLGLIGLGWHYQHNRKDMSIVLLLFFFTGLAIVLYLNDTPMQPRERDYAYVGAFYAFAIWIGLGVIALTSLAKKRSLVFSTTLLCLLAVPFLLLYQGWDDHDRSEKYTTRDLYARNYLASCEPNAILFTYGDNDTFPIWYAQEVEGIRPDVRIVNIGYLNSDWYLKQMRKRINNSAPLPIDIEPAKVDKGVRDYLVYEDYHIDKPVEIKDLLDIMLSDHPDDKSDRTGENFLPTKKMKLMVNKEDVMKNKVVPKAWQDFITDSMEWDFNRNYITRGDLAILDLLKNNAWKRPIYFVKIPPSETLGLDKYFVNEGLLYRLMPVDLAKTNTKATAKAPVDTQHTNRWAMYHNLMHRYNWANVNKLNYLDPLTRNIVPQYTNNFNILSRELLEVDQKAKAKDVVNKCLEVLPKQVLSMNQAIDYYFISDTLYEVNEKNKANELMKRNGDYIIEQLNYNLAIAKDKPNVIDERNIRLGMGLLNAMLDNSKKYKQMDMEKYLGNQYAMLERKITAISQ
ncbi:glycosyltransferase family 117 protein [Olivibacter jilunii]|uniref:glycosyltransferase family 117 protein n=1 Tax=Olivibacter jilunii TaxID=985016 RepID=UPI003F18A0EC